MLFYVLSLASSRWIKFTVTNNVSFIEFKSQILKIFLNFRFPSFQRIKILRNKNTTPVAFVEYADVCYSMQAKTYLSGYVVTIKN